MTHEPDLTPDEPEVVDGLPVLAADAPDGDLSEIAPAAPPAVVPARQAAALAASSFLAGAVTVAMVHRRRSRGLAKALRKKKPRTALGEIVTSNSFLVDVHLLRRD